MSKGIPGKNAQQNVQPRKKPIKTHIIPEFPGNPRNQKCKIPVVRSSKPAFCAVEPAPQYHQLTFSKTNMSKGIPGKNAQQNVQPRKKNIKTHIIPEFPGNPRNQKCKIPIVRSAKPAFLQWNLHLNITNLHFPRRKAPKAFLERMRSRMYNLEKKQSKPIKYQNCQGILGTKKCKIPVVRSSKPAFCAVEPAPQYHQLTFSKTKVSKGIAGKNAQQNVQPRKKPIKTHIIPEFPGNPRNQKCKIPVVRSSKLAFLQWNLHLNITNLHFPRPKAPKAFLERMHNRMYNLEKKKHQNPYNTRIPRES